MIGYPRDACALFNSFDLTSKKSHQLLEMIENKDAPKGTAGDLHAFFRLHTRTSISALAHDLSKVDGVVTLVIA